MQASKIEPKEVYAVRRGDVGGQTGDATLVRFHVTAILSRRTGKGPHLITSQIEGYVLAADGGQDGATFKLKPETLLGPYQQHVELVERERAEKQARDRKNQEREAALERLRVLLYKTTGLAVPQEKGARHPFVVSLGRVEINADGVAALTAVLETKGGDQ